MATWTITEKLNDHKERIHTFYTKKHLMTVAACYNIILARVGRYDFQIIAGTMEAE